MASTLSSRSLTSDELDPIEGDEPLRDKTSLKKSLEVPRSNGMLDKWSELPRADDWCNDAAPLLKDIPDIMGVLGDSRADVKLSAVACESTDGELRIGSS